MKYLIVGLGNIGEEYKKTRHNIGFEVLDAMVKASNSSFSDKRYGFVAILKHKGRIFVCLKPNTYMNLSGKAVNYWLQKEKIPIKNLLVVVDDLAIPFGTIRIKSKGNNGGHNGLKNIDELLGTNNYSRLRFGIGNEFGQGQQVNYVLSKWSEDEEKQLEERIKKMSEAVYSFGSIGIERTMNFFNGK